MAVKKAKKSSPKARRKTLLKTPQLKAKAPMRAKVGTQMNVKLQPKKKAAKGKAPKIKASQPKKRGKPAAPPAKANIKASIKAKPGVRAKITARPLPQPESGPALETHAHAIDNLQHQELLMGSETSKELSRRRIAEEKSKHSQYPIEDKRAVARQEHTNGSTPLRGL